MITATFLLLIAGFVCTIAAAMNKCPMWVPILLLYVIGLLAHLPK
jgi:hypothetical protein